MKRTLKILLPFLVVAAGALAALLMILNREVVEPEAFTKPLPLVEVTSLHRQDHQFMIRAQGTVTAPTEISLVAEVAGRVVQVAPVFVNGGFFEADEVLLQIDTRDYEVALAQAKARLAEAEVRLQREEAEAEVARSEWERVGGGEPGPLLLREPQLAEAQALVDSALANLSKAKLDLERCLVRAPFAGRVRSKRADLGQFLNRGESVARIYAVDFAEVPLPLPLDEVAYVDLPVGYRGEPNSGASPRVTLRAQFGNREAQWEGRIVRTVGEIDPQTRMVTAVARVDNPYGRAQDWTQPPLAVGLFVDAEIHGRLATNVFVGPRSAFRGSDDLKVVDAENRLRFQRVEKLRTAGDQVVFRAELEDTDRVCLTVLDAATDSMEVLVVGDEDSPGASNL
jgi:RND family efflux transporter MFP subunit